MGFISKLIGKVQAYFTDRDRIDALKTALSTYGLTADHLRFALREVIEINGAEMGKVDKRDNVVGSITQAHNDALTFDGGLKWPDPALKDLITVVQIVYAIAKLANKLR